MTITIAYHFYQNIKHLQKSLLSLTEQTDLDFELFLINDGGSNKASEIVNNIDLSKIKQCHYVVFSQNLGHSYSYNYVINKSESTYIHFSGSNFVYEKDFIAKLKKYIVAFSPDLLIIQPTNNDQKLEYTISHNIDRSLMNNFIPSIKDKIFSMSILKKHKINFTINMHAPLFFLLSYLQHVNRTTIVHLSIISKLRNTYYSYNLYDVFDQNILILSNLAKNSVWVKNKDFFEFVLIYSLIHLFLPRIFTIYNDSSVRGAALKATSKWLTKYIPK